MAAGKTGERAIGSRDSLGKAWQGMVSVTLRINVPPFRKNRVLFI